MAEKEIDEFLSYGRETKETIMHRKQDERLAEIIRLYEACDERGKNDILIFSREAAEITAKYKKLEEV